MISSIEIKNLLSFSSQTPAFKLNRLNILIGANGSGKSNFLEVFAFLRALTIPQRASGSLDDVISRGGGIQEWTHKSGDSNKSGDPNIVELKVRFFEEMKYLFRFTQENRDLRILAEEISSNAIDTLIYDFNYKHPILLDHNFNKISINSLDFNSSVLGQIKYPNTTWYLSKITTSFEKIKLYRNWSFGHYSILRQPQRADMRNSVLEEDFSNFCLFLSRLFRTPSTKQKIIEAFKEVYDGITDINIDIGNANAALFISEGDKSIPAIRLSDGTLRYLVLVTLLLDPDPPPLICLEEPELGMHPDLIRNIAKLLKDAATRTQLIVTTHSELLVNAFSSDPESIVVCEKENGVTTLKRLETNRLDEWLEQYGLGDLWLRGEIGGVRW